MGDLGPITLGVGVGGESSHLLKEQAEIMSQVTEPVFRAHGKEARVPVSTQGSRTLSAKKVPDRRKG